MGGIFISYRRDDTADITGRIADHLVTRYGKPAVFKDVDNIPYGADFPAFIRQQLAACSVCLAVIGPRWLAPGPDGHRRLDDPSDFVRLEIETALALGRVVVPVLVNGATMPLPGSLPPSLARLHYVNAALVRLDPDFTADVRRLCEVTDRFVPPQVPLAAPYFAPSGPYAAPPKPPRQPLSRKARWGIIAGVIAGVLLLSLGGFGVARYNSAASTVRQWAQDEFDVLDQNTPATVRDSASQGMWQLYCPDVQARVSESQLQAFNESYNSGGENLDSSNLHFTVVDWSLTEAHVRESGSYDYTRVSDGARETITVSTSSDNVHTLSASGLGWCLTEDAVPANLR